MMPDLGPAYAEILVALGAMALLLVGVIRKGDVFSTVSRLSVFTLLGALAILLLVPNGGAGITFSGLFIQDGFSFFIKVMVLLGGMAAILMSTQYLRDHGLDRFEFPVLVLTATLGMMMMVSAWNFLSLYLGLELQSLSLYVLAAFNRDRQRSSEAGLKYFVLGALSSGMLLYGISLIYGFTGSTSFDVLKAVFETGEASTGVLVGLVFVLTGLAFKVSAVPFHMWTPDVYEGAPTPVTAFFASAPKIAAMALFLRVMLDGFPGLLADWQPIIILISVASMMVGAFVALVQTNIKRLLAYSSIGHVGYALIGLAAGTTEGVQAVLVYLAIYMTMTIGVFAVVLMMRRKEGMAENIEDLAGLSKTRPGMAAALMIFMFSLAGIPLLAGFFGKWFIFWSAVNAGLVWLAVVGFLASVVGAFYYLRIIKVMYFDEPAPAFEANTSKAMGWLLTTTAVLNSPVSFFLIGPLLAVALAAAQSLMG